MTDFAIFALAMPVVGTVFVACFAFVVMRFIRHDAESEKAGAAKTDLKQAAE